LSALVRERPVVIGSAADEHVESVTTALAARGVEALVIDAAALGDVGYQLTETGTALEGQSLDGARGWIRRVAPDQWHEDDPPSSYGGALRSAWLSLLVGLCETTRVEWLTTLSALFSAENKLVQWRAVQKLGIDHPKTAVVSNAASIPEELGQHLVAKPLGAGDFRDETGALQVVYTRQLDRDDPRLDALSGAPFIVQERLEAQRHLRIVTVGERVWANELHAEGVALDWRETEAAHDAFRSVEVPESLVKNATTIASALRVGYSSQDWIVCPNRTAFVDLNPAGQWLFLPCAAEVSDALAEWLSS
jgi:hypothetical protein